MVDDRIVVLTERQETNVEGAQRVKYEESLTGVKKKARPASPLRRKRTPKC